MSIRDVEEVWELVWWRGRVVRGRPVAVCLLGSVEVPLCRHITKLSQLSKRRTFVLFSQRRASWKSRLGTMHQSISLGLPISWVAACHRVFRRPGTPAEAEQENKSSAEEGGGGTSTDKKKELAPGRSPGPWVGERQLQPRLGHPAPVEGNTGVAAQILDTNPRDRQAGVSRCPTRSRGNLSDAVDSLEGRSGVRG